MGKPYRLIVPALIAALLLGGCGGGGGSDATSSSSSGSFANTTVTAQSGTASDGLARFNYWRNLLTVEPQGSSPVHLQPISRESHLDAAAQDHSNYQAYNNVIDHYEITGKRYFTGVCLIDDINDSKCNPTQTSRLEQAQYPLPVDNYAVGEVISETKSASGTAAADALVTAIYHRFVIFEPMFKEAGAGAATSGSTGDTYFTVDFGAIGLDQGLGWGKVAVFPKDGQNPPVPTTFLSNTEIPDPIPSTKDQTVGYPISVHADLIYSLEVSHFTVVQHGDSELLLVQELWHPADDNIVRPLVPAIVPLSPLKPETTYDVHFDGWMVHTYTDQFGVERTDRTPLTLDWSFKTK